MASLGLLGQTRSADYGPESTLLQPASSSAGRFRILRPHARGGLGQVSVALDQELNREVALKEIQPAHADDEVSQRRFLLEAEITGGLEHPGIVPVYALGHGPDGRPFYAMRFVKGDSLKKSIEDFHRADNPNRNDPGARELARRQLLGRFIDVCNAMEYAHSRGVLHRDLKPGNIMVGRYGETLVVDWGLAKSVEKEEIVSDEPTLRPSSALSGLGQTLPGLAIGTPSYMSPEQAAGRLDDLGPASDVYSLGATLYHLLCGRPPFVKGDVHDILQRVERGEFERPRQIDGEIPAPLEAICLKSMALKSVDRYETARALADDLEHWLADEPVTALPDGIGDRLRRMARRHRGYVLVAGLAMLVVAVVSSAAAVLINKQRIENHQLATEMGRLADRNAGLYESEREAKLSAEQLAVQNRQLAQTKSQLADDERKARLATDRQLRIATAERLAALSHSRQWESPELSLLLAVESGGTSRQGDVGLLSGSHQALLDALAGIGGRRLSGHRQAVSQVEISPDGRWIVTASTDGTARLWDLTAPNPGANPRVLSGREIGFFRVAISADSRWLVTASFDNTAQVWDISGEERAGSPRVLSGHQAPIRCVAISPDSRWVVTGSHDLTARLWDLSAENPSANPHVLVGHRGPVWRVAISPDGHWIVTGSVDGKVRVWDLTALNPADNPRVLSGHEGNITGLAICADSRRLVTAGVDKTARVWDLTVDPPAARPPVLGHHDQSADLQVAISPDGRWIVTGCNTTAWLWDVAAANPAIDPFRLEGHERSISSVAISPDGHWIVTGSADKTARVWDLTSENPGANPLVLSGHQSGITCVAISADSRWIFTGSSDNTVRVWDLSGENPRANARVLSGHQSRISGVAVSSDNRWIATGSLDRTARLWMWRWDDLVANAASTGRNFGREEWPLFFGDEPYRKTFADLPVPGDPVSALDFLVRGREYLATNQPALAILDLTEAIRLNPRLLDAYVRRGEINARHGDTAQAAIDFGAAYALEPNSLDLAQKWAYLLFASGNLELYAQACVQLRDHFGTVDVPDEALILSRILILSLQTVGDTAALVQLAQQAFKSNPDLWWSRHVLAGAYLRDGQFDAALSTLDEIDRARTVEASPSVDSWLPGILNDSLRAIALAKLGRFDEATTVHQRVEQASERHLKGTPELPFGGITPFWWNWYPIQAFRREAEQLIRENGGEK